MGKIKSKLVRRSTNTFLKEGVEFTESFDKNKKILKMTMPSKKVRNQIAGFLARTRKQKIIISFLVYQFYALFFLGQF